MSGQHKSCAQKKREEKKRRGFYEKIFKPGYDVETETSGAGEEATGSRQLACCYAYSQY